MASTYDELGTEVMATGENINTWGTKLNEAKALLIEAIKGVASAAITEAGLTLTIPQNAPGLGRKALVKIDGAALTAPGNVTVPAIQKTWFFHYFGSAQPLLVTAGGAPVTVRPNSFALIYCDGVDVFNPETSLDRIKSPAAAVNFNNQKATNLAEGTENGDAATVGQIGPFATASAASAGAAASSAGSAAGSATAAAGSASAAAGSAGAALSSQNKASEWADKPEDSPIETGPDRFSAFHWSRKAQGWASSVNLPAIQPGDAGKALIVNPAETGYLFGSPKDFTRIARTSNVVIGAANLGQFIDITANTFTQTFAAVSGLPAGWFVYLRNSGSGDITLDPNGSEQIDGLTSYIMYPGEMRLIYKDGSGLASVVMTAFYKTFTTSGNFIKPPGYTLFDFQLWGGGGGGAKGGNDYTVGGGGGGGGACISATIPASFAISSTVTIAAGGAAIPASPNTGVHGNSGGDSSFAGFTAYGGAGGRCTSAANQMQNGGSGGGALGAGISADGSYVPGGPPAGYVNSNFPDGNFGGGASGPGPGAASVYGGGGGGGGRNSAGSGFVGGKSLYGGAGGGGGGWNTTGNGAGGTSVYGGAGGGGSTNTIPATNGSAPAGGGGGAFNLASGAGGRGELRIWGII